MATEEKRNEYWGRWLGFVPEQTFEPSHAEYKCYKCNSTNVEPMPAGSWTSKKKCLAPGCGYITYISHADFMSGAVHEDVAIDLKDAEFK